MFSHYIAIELQGWHLLINGEESHDRLGEPDQLSQVNIAKLARYFMLNIFSTQNMLNIQRKYQ